jgi:Zn-finger nucleic acid-binding protein
MTTRPLHCPRSTSIPLVQLRIGGISTDVCEDCGGLWLDRLELARFENPASALGDALVAHLSQFPPALVDHSVRLCCPLHRDTVMLRRKFSASVPVEIDECPQCGGIWLDSDELARIRG